MVPIRLAKGSRPGLVTAGDTADHTVCIWDLGPWNASTAST
jgi:hypothetical protein